MSEDFKKDKDTGTSLPENTRAVTAPPQVYQPARLRTPLLQDTTNHLLPILRRRKAMAVGITLLCLGAGLYIIGQIRPLYQTSAQISFKGQDETFINTQIRYLKIAPLTMSWEQESPKGLSFKSLALDNNTQGTAETAQAPAIKPLSTHRLQVSHIPGSSLVELHYYGHNPYDIAPRLNHFIEQYIAQLNAKQLSSEKEEKPKSSPEEDPQYIQAKAKYLALKAQLSAFISKDGAINLHGNKQAEERLRSKALDALIERKRSAAYDLETLSLRYGEKHPKIIEARKIIETLDAQIRHERETLLGRMIDDYITAKTTFDAIEKAHNAAPEETSETTNTPPPVVQLVKPAHTPLTPIFPNRLQLFGITLLASLFFGIMVPTIVERSRKTFLCGQQLSNFFGLPCYALIPEIKATEHKELADYVLNNPSDTLAEAVRSLRLNIKLKNHSNNQENKVVLVTSSKAGEGKTTLSTWLARMTAKTGERVLLIDANLRDPAVHKALHGKNTLSLVEYLTGKSSLEKVTDTTDPTGLHAIYGRSIPNSVLDLLSSKKMGELLQETRKSYDLIIIDTPPCLMSADARALSPHADLLLYLVGWNKTKRDVIHKGLSQFLNFTEIRTALVLSNIDIKKHTAYGYGEVVCEDDA